MPRRSHLAAVTCAIGLFAATPHVQADPADDGGGMPIPEKARFLADRGRQLQRDGKFAEALEAYKAAYVLAPSPGLLFNLAQAYRLNGDCDDAAWMYRRFLETEPRDDLRALVNEHLARLSACTHAGFRTSIEAPNVARDTRPAMPSQPARPSPVVATPVPTGPPPGHGERVAGTYLMIGGGVALVVAAGFALDASAAANDITAAYKNGMNHPDLRSLDDRGRRDDTITAVAGITGGLALVSGAVLYGLGRHAEQAQHVAFVPHRDGGEVRVAWHF
jgi:tetratricopeptide (TPR) repeat protein